MFEQDILDVFRMPRSSSLVRISLGCTTTSETIRAVAGSGEGCLLPQLASVELTD